MVFVASKSPPLRTGLLTDASSRLKPSRLIIGGWGQVFRIQFPRVLDSSKQFLGYWIPKTTSFEKLNSEDLTPAPSNLGAYADWRPALSKIDRPLLFAITPRAKPSAD